MAFYIGGIERSRRRRRLPVQGNPWTPFHLGDALLAFWDAEDSAALTLTGSSVTTWADSKNGHAPTQASAGSKPSWSATGFNGRPGVSFDGVDDYLSILGAIPFPQAATPCELWALADFTLGHSVTSSIIGWGDGITAVSNRALRKLGSGYANALFGNGTSNSVITNNSTAVYGRHVLRARFEQFQGSLSVDGGSPTTTAGALNSTAANNFSLGQGVLGANNYMKGTINSVLVTGLLTEDYTSQLLEFLKIRGSLS